MSTDNLRTVELHCPDSPSNPVALPHHVAQSRYPTYGREHGTTQGERALPTGEFEGPDVPPPGLPPPGPQDAAEDKLSTNGLGVNPNALDRLSTQSLGTWQGDSLVFAEEHFPGLLEVPNPKAETPEGSGRALLGYLVTCALEETQTLHVPSTGDTYQGRLGLAPEWSDSDCDESCQRWITACALAHGNSNGGHVTFSPRGNHPSLHWSGETSKSFVFQEAAFYGNMFEKGTERELFVCAGLGSLQEFFDLLSFDLSRIDSMIEGRVCASGISCGLELSGLCIGGIEVPLLGEMDFTACSDVVGDQGSGFYTECGFSSNMNSPLSGERVVSPYTEVITTYAEL